MKIDMHMHSNHSRDGTLSVEKIVRIVKKKKLDGFSLTEHDSYSSADKAKVLAKKAGLIFIPGVEIKTNVGDVLVYNFSEPILTRRFEEVLDIAKSQEAKVAIAHPFDSLRRKSALLDENIIKKFKREIDFLEINGRSMPSLNKRVKNFALDHGLKLIAGSDAHFGFEIGKCFSIISDIDDLKVEGINYNYSYLNILSLGLTKLYKTFKTK